MPGPGLLSQFFVWANSHHTADTGNISGHPKPGQTQNPLQPTERREWLHVDAEGNLKHIAVSRTCSRWMVADSRMLQRRC